MRWLAIAGCLLVLGSASAAERHPLVGTDLLRMHKGGLKGSTILDFISIYRVSLRVSESEFITLGEAGLEPATLQALRDRMKEASPATLPSAAGAGKESETAIEDPLPRFFVGYPHDPAVFPSWYYGPFAADSVSGSQHPGRNATSGRGWGGTARDWRFSARWSTGRRF